MLELKNIQKDYPVGNDCVHALKGVDLAFRKSEFVSILGPSGCGKTTMLNIIGGLDQYTEGDLVIGGRSTKDFKDRDWDCYRNHSVGFVFQNYHLIPHQTVLQNVELALSLTGVPKNERKKRAIKALEEVGLADQLNKKPGEMSGGQMQRVAIARAIVNDPEIILADEPTGALDTETSHQVMALLKEISQDRLIIMVTHNPDLAKEYSTRIIQMLDGKITDDSAPLAPQEGEGPAPAPNTKKKNHMKKPSMKFSTSFGLSLKNLISKKGRTILTSLAGSIGIIGIALIFAVSHGMSTFIDTVQEETLSSYPLTLQAQHMDMSTLMKTFVGKAKAEEEHEKDAVYQKTMVYEMINSLNHTETKENDLAAFQKHLESQWAKSGENNKLNTALNGVQYTYDVEPLVYTKNVDGSILRSDTEELLQELLIEYFGMDISSMKDMKWDDGFGGSAMMGPQMNLWQEILPAKDGGLINELLYKQYDVIYGAWPSKYNEIVLVVDENNEIDDITLYALGLKSKEDIDALAKAAFDKKEIEILQEKWSYQEICDMEFRIVLGSDCYTLDEKTGHYSDLRETKTGLKYLYDNGTKLKVTGIVRQKENAVSGMLTGSIGYTASLTEYILEKAASSPAVSAQKKDPTVDIFSGLPFQSNTGELSRKEKAKAFQEYLSHLKENEKAEAYLKIKSIPSSGNLNNFLDATLKGKKRADLEKILTDSFSAQTNMNTNEMADYISTMTDKELNLLFREMLTEKYKQNYAEQVRTQLLPMGTAALSSALDSEKGSYTEKQSATYYEEVLTFSDSDYESNLKQLGCVDLTRPATINLYASTFENKEVLEDFILDYNNSVDDLKEIRYTDYVGLMMSSVTTIINAIAYVLIAFVGVSLVVSSIMIGVITLISVQERTKEIGILRAIGASKKNVSGMFNAETVIIGFTSGTLGVLITYLLCLPINWLLHTLTGISNLNAHLPIPVALVLVAISVLLTLLAGIIPSRSAAKKDPVVALRTE